jgi:hypothetical protein
MLMPPISHMGASPSIKRGPTDLTVVSAQIPSSVGLQGVAGLSGRAGAVGALGVEYVGGALPAGYVIPTVDKKDRGPS